MRFSLRFLLVAGAAFSLSACDSFFDLVPETSVSQNEVYTDATGAEAAINGVYNSLQGVMTDELIMSELAADNAQHTGSYPSWLEVDTNNLSVDNAESTGLWIGWYDVINNANNIIAAVQGTPGLDPDRANEIQGEAYAARAYSYHALTTWFGDVPLVLDPTLNVDPEAVQVSRSSTDEVYAQIISDLRTAEGLVAESQSVGLIDRDVVRAILARVLLYDGQYAEAGQIATELSVAYPLTDLTTLYGNLNSGESIWELQYTTDDSNSMAFFAFSTGAGGRREYAPTQAFADLFAESDDRYDFNIETQGANLVFNKYFRVATGTDHYFLFRGGEMILIAAEVAARAGNTSTAVSLVNEIRSRAGAPSVDAGTIGSAGAALDLVLAERRIELNLEGHRWHDLVRTGRAVSALGLPSTDQTLWPIPERDRKVNPNLSQNPGY